MKIFIALVLANAKAAQIDLIILPFQMERREGWEALQMVPVYFVHSS